MKPLFLRKLPPMSVYPSGFDLTIPSSAGRDETTM
jgi:hypothetical protein